MSTATLTTKNPRPWLIYAGFIALTVIVGGFIGTQNLPGEWYDGLNKPPFNPPNWIFGPVWTTLYVLIGIAGARIFLIDNRSTAMKLWVAQMLLNWIWSPIWFGAQQIWPAFAVILAILISIIAFMTTARPIDKLSTWLFAPYLAWVSFATLLNLSIGLLN